VSRGALLHARSRNLLPGFVCLIALAVGIPLLTRLLDTRWGVGGFLMFDVYLLTAAAGVTLLGTGLAAPDPELEASAPHSGARLRLVHIVVAVAAVMGALIAGYWLLLLPSYAGQVLPWRESVFIAEAVAVLAGVQLLGAALYRARLSWVPGMVWVILLLGSDHPARGWKIIGTLPKGEPSNPFFAYTAAVALLLGTIVYVAKRIPR
jgi:hypothetical protein